jgi:phosphatidate cytidylyltransferase
LLALTGIVVITIPALAGFYLVLHLSDVTLRFLLIILTIWCFDVFAYLGGSFFGKRPLARRISPKKTVEGTIVGIAFTFLFALLFYKITGQVAAMESFGIAGIVIVMGQAGDLLQSLHKRTAEVKDSGRLMPGHGGIWDRFDSLLGVLPALYLYYTFVLHTI